MTRIATVVTLSVLALCGATSSIAATASGVLAVQATVLSTCTVTSGALVFGVVDPGTGTSSVSSVGLAVTCTQGTTFSVGLGDGANASSGQRRMKGTLQAQYLHYELFRDSAATQRFGDGIVGQRVVGQTGLGLTANVIPVYGTVASGQSAPADTYADTVPITVYY